jgi:tetratricopeptide (TPR) repeat protein
MNEASRALNEATIAAQQGGRFEEARARYRQAIQLNPRLIAAYEQFSLLLLSNHRYEEGVAVMTAGVAANPGNKPLQGHLGIHKFQSGAATAGHKLLRETAGSEGLKDRYEVQLVLIQSSILLEDLRTTIAAIQRYLAARPSGFSEKDSSFRIQLARAYLRTDASDLAERELKRALEERPQSLRGRVTQAELDLRARRCQQAYSALQRLQLLSQNLEVPLLMGEAMLCLKRSSDALQVADSFLTKHGARLAGLVLRPVHPHQPFAARTVLRHAHTLRGEAALGLGRHETALAAFKEVMALGAGSGATQVRIAEVLFNLKQYDKALDQLDAQLRQASPSRQALVLGIRTGVRGKKLQVALRCADRLGKLAKPTAEEQYYAGIAYASSGQFPQATTLFRRAIQLEPKHTGAREELERALMRLARRELAKNDLAAATKLVEEALAASPRSPLVNQNMAVLLLKQGKSAQALGHALTAANAQPHSGPANRVAGHALLLAGRHKDAVARYQRTAEKGGLEGEPLAIVLSELGVARVRSGQAEQGIADMEAAIKLLAKESPHLAVVQGNLARGRLARGAQLLDSNTLQPALKDLDYVAKHAGSLTDQEKAWLHVSRILALTQSGNLGPARETWRSNGEQLLKALEPSFAALSEAIPTYIDHHVRARRPDLVRRLERLYARASAPAREKMRELLVNDYLQSALESYEEGKTPAAVALLNKAKRVARVITPEAKHNIAVAEYGSAATREASVKTLQTLGVKVPIALCNLAVHFDGKGGTPQKAFELFNQCNARGVRFPNLKSILAIKRLIFSAQQP